MLASEKASGCKLDLDLSSATTVIRQRGTIFGALPKDGGFYFDGTNDYIQYILGSEFYSDAISYVIEFTPEFNWDEDEARPLIDSTDELGNINKRFAVYKSHSGDGYAIVIWCGNVSISILPAVYSAYWKLNQKNTIVVSANNTVTTVYLNGIKIANAVAHVWTKIINVNRLHLGTICTLGFYYFKGLIHSFKIYNRALSDQECLDYCNNATFLYEQRATIILPMRLQDHDPTNLRTLDVSGHGYHATFGDGVPPTTYPTKISGKRGYSFDGGDYLIFPASLNSIFTGVFQNPFTLIMFTKGFIGYSFNKGALGVSWFKTLLTTPIKYAQFKGSDAVNHVSGMAAAQPGFDYIKLIQIVNKINSGSVGSMKWYINNSDRLQTNFNGSDTFIENDEQALIGLNMQGEYYYFALYPFSLTQIQMADLYIKLLQDINHE